MSLDELPAADAPGDVPDVRLYVADPEDWQVYLKQDSEKIYCYQKNPGENYFHLILKGEIYLSNQDEKLCLRCALRRGVLTQDRLIWQHRVTRRKPPVI
jgi:sulfur relay (sulfurtransferase) complex TusBCD TusD component (DsrE family)